MDKMFLPVSMVLNQPLMCQMIPSLYDCYVQASGLESTQVAFWG